MLINPPGIPDIFPDKIEAWNFVVSAARDVFKMNNYKEIIIPILEYTDVFARGLGNETDIVSKEMFTFEDRGGRSLTMRPEGTASVVRAYVGNGEYNRLSSAKFFYFGPMFRAERPQKGRLRQFNQFGAEFFGSIHPYYDFEIISVMDKITKKTGIKEYSILINSIGCPECRKEYIKELKKYYHKNSAGLCEDCQRRLENNTLRLLDCKQEGCSVLKKNAPLITSHLCDGCRSHYSKVKAYLDMHEIAYQEDPYLVRGLDYYTRTTFEFTTPLLGGQNAFAGGGRYDNLVETFGGRPTSAIGFAAGIERMLLLIEGNNIPGRRLDVYMVHSGAGALEQAIKMSAMLRSSNISVELDPEAKGFKSQFKKADREMAKFAVIIAEDEAASNTCTIKNLSTGAQEKVSSEKCIEFLYASM